MSTFAVKAISRNKIKTGVAKRCRSIEQIEAITDVIFSADPESLKEMEERKARPSVVSPFYDSPKFAQENLEEGLRNGDYRDATIVCKVAGKKGAKKVTRVISWVEGMSYSESLDAAGVMPL